MREPLLALACLATSTVAGAAPDAARLVLENPRVSVWLGSDRDLAAHPQAVVVPLEDTAAARMGAAFWSSSATPGGAGARGPLMIVEPKPAPPPAPESDTGTRPGEQASSGMSFSVLFENERVTVMRARMEVGAREGFHTHRSDVVIVHLSGGAIEDTADGKTQVKRWTHGDVEFEARGTSHSARNAGKAVDVVLVTLKP